MKSAVTQIRLSLSNAYLVKGQACILVDTGSPGEESKILKAAAQAGFKPADITLILHTHGHADHAGSTAALRRLTGAPAAVHPADAEMMHSGRMRPLNPLRLEARLIRPVVEKPFPPVEVDLLLAQERSLDEFGVAGSLLFTPGHTAGSLALLLDSGDLIAGDVLMGGVMGGRLRGRHPNYHYFAEDFETLRHSIQSLLALKPRRFFVGHGGPLDFADVLAWAEKQAII